MDPEEIVPNQESEAQSQLAHQLGERVKELNCLFGISDIVERAGGSLERILAETVELLPQSWDQSEIACARIILGGRQFRTKSCGGVVSTQRAEILVYGRRAGAIEISYSEARPDRFEGPFSREERRLLDAVAERMGRVVERLTAAERLREAEEQFRDRLTHVTRVSTMGEMASSIAHEVNQPLTAIATYAQACRRLVESGQVETHEVVEVLDRIGDESIRAGQIIHRLRGLVRKQECEMEPCDVGILLGEISPLALADARLNGVALEFAVSPGLPLIQGDGVQIQQVVLNLIRNAFDAMADLPESRRAVEVRAALSKGGDVLIGVTDQGCGIPEGNEDHLFERFFTTKEGGLGLGLAISRSIVTSHGGRIWYSGNPGGGTTFHFTLPVHRGTDDD